MNPIVEVENLTKIYRLGILHGSYLTFRDAITQLFYVNHQKRKKHYIKALDNVNLTIEKGQKIGVIGKNGAGKSTFLKILSRITYPTSGSVILRGRVASLLEVGTGFHGELTGRENVYLNGAILGMKRQEINKKFDDIVAFSGVEKFIDTPVKHYSSGMQMRLAFAVSAFLDADIMLVDEVLAVGDTEFQKKCLGKMDEVSNTEGRTIIFVSHNLNAISNLCEKSALFVNGHIDTFDDTDGTVENLIISQSQLLNEQKTEAEIIQGITKANENYNNTLAEINASNDTDIEKKNKILNANIQLRDSLLKLSLIHISEPTRLLSISYAVFCLKKKNKKTK